MNLLTRAKPVLSLKNRRKKAGWNQDYLEKIHSAHRLRGSSDSLGKVGLWIDCVELAGLDETRQAGPVFAALATAGEQAILS